MKLVLNGINVGLVDERGEISGLYKGIPQNSVGLRTDILENTPKPTGIKMLIRSMAPQVVVADEIGTYEDIKAIKEAVCSRCEGKEELVKNPVLKELVEERVIEKYLFLDRNRKIEVA